MENVSIALESNVVSIEARKSRVPSLTEMAKLDPDIKEFVRLVAKYDLRKKAVALLNKKLSRKRIHSPSFFR